MGDLLLSIVRGRPCCFARERAECSSEASDLARSLWHCEQEVAILVHEHVNWSRDVQEDRYGSVGRNENDVPSLWYHSRC
jgi:hypothetical protein